VRELTIDWAALHSAFQMNMPEVRCFLSLEDGRVLKLPPGDAALATVRADPQRYVPVEAIPSRIQYQWLDEFIHAIEEGDTRTRMEAAINGKGAFRRFKDILLTLPDERRRWFEYRDQMMRHRIVEWIREQGITPLNDAPWSAGEVYNPVPMDEQQPSSLMAYAAASTSVHDVAPVSYPPLREAKEEKAPVATSENLGNIATSPQVKMFGRSISVQNNQHEIEALRDFLIEWSDTRSQNAGPGPLELETLATEIGKHFHVKSAHI
jgi:hypothetical protein